MSAYRQREGDRAEALVAEWYRLAGYEVLERNWRCEAGEIDLVCRMGAVLVICEVKSRRTGAYGTGLDAITPAKRRRLRRLAARWLRAHGEHCATVRFDAAAVSGLRVNVVEEAW